MLKKLVVCLLLISFLVACSADGDQGTMNPLLISSSPTISKTPAPGQTPSPISSTDIAASGTASAHSAATGTETARETTIVEYLKTATAFALTPSPTPAPSWTPAGLPPQMATISAFIDQYPEYGEYESTMQSCLLYPDSCAARGLGISPNGEWIAFFAVEETAGLKIASIDGNYRWKIYFSEISGMKCPCGDSVVAVKHWSQDGRYLYLTPKVFGDGGDGIYWGFQEKLIRFNLFNGTWVDTQMGTAAVFSPNDRYLVFRSGNEVVVYEFRTGIRMTFKVPDEIIKFGDFVWSPESHRLVFVGAKEILESHVNETGLNL